MRTLLLTIHILGAAAWIGGGLFASVSFNHLAATLGVRRVLDLDSALGSRFFGAAVGAVVLSGVGLVLLSGAYEWGTAFVLVGLGVVVLDGALEGAVFGPRLKKLAAAPEPGLAEYRRLVWTSTAVHLVLLTFAVWAMVVRLGV